MADLNEIDRLDLLIIKGMALVQDMLVGIAAHRGVGTEEKLRKVPMAKLARQALSRPEEATLLELVLEAAKVRNQPAHQLQTDEFVTDFVDLWNRVKGNHVWPSDAIHQRDYCQTFFVLLAFELHRCGHDLPPTDQLAKGGDVDWERHRRIHDDARRARQNT